MALASFAVILPLASTTLPDFLWAGGVYDGSDYDDLILLSGEVSWHPDLLVEPRPVHPAAVFTAPLDVAIFVTVACVSVQMRAPPGALARPLGWPPSSAPASSRGRHSLRHDSILSSGFTASTSTS